MSRKPWGWSAIHAGWPGYVQTKPILVGWKGRGGATRRGRGSGFTDRSTGRTWRGGYWLCTDKPSTAWIKGGWERRVTGKAEAKSPWHSGWYSWQRQVRGPSQLRGVVSGRRRGQPFGWNSGTGTSSTPWWYWRRETSPIHGALCATCWIHGGPWMGCTSAQRSARRGRSGSDGAWRRRRKGLSPQGRLALMDPPLR